MARRREGGGLGQWPAQTPVSQPRVSACSTWARLLVNRQRARGGTPFDRNSYPLALRHHQVALAIVEAQGMEILMARQLRGLPVCALLSSRRLIDCSTRSM